MACRAVLGLALPLLASAATLMELIEARPELSLFRDAVLAANLTGPLNRAGVDLTLFAPSNAAVQAIAPDTAALLREPVNYGALRSVLLYHTVPGTYDMEQLLFVTIGLGRNLTTLAGGATLSVTTAADRTRPRVNGANITAVDVEADNGMMHIIDTVLMPPGLVLQTPPEATPTPGGEGGGVPTLPGVPSVSPRVTRVPRPGDDNTKTFSNGAGAQVASLLAAAAAAVAGALLA